MRKKGTRFCLCFLLVTTLLCSSLLASPVYAQSDETGALKSEAAVRASEWKAGQPYSIGDLVSYQGSIYKCTLAHTGQLGWEPSVAGALWEKQSVVSTPTTIPTSTATQGQTGLKVQGYILPDFTFDTAAASVIKAGFKVELVEKGLSVLTDANGYFELSGIASSTSAGYTLRISKDNYLQRNISNLVITGNVKLGSEAQSVDIWAGDMMISGAQDNVINMADIMETVKYFNTTKGDGKYLESSDLNKDNSINMADIMIMVKHFNKTSADYPAISGNTDTPTPTSTTTATKIPSSTSTPTPTPTSVTTIPSATPGNDDVLSVGQSRTLTDVQINSLWSGMDPQYSPDNAAASVQAALSKTDYEALFPMRIGSAEWHAFAKGESYYKADQADYYSYDNFIAAVKEVANIKYKIVTREGSTWLQQIYRLDKSLKKETKLYQTKEFNDDWVINKPLKIQIVDFGSFLKEGLEKDRKRELAGFLANIAHETGGGWETAPGGMLRWGLYWNEEVSYIGSSSVGYVDGSNADYPPVAGKSYHGRGPIQLSWNYNYGLFSAIIYGDKNVLLQQPEKVTQDGKLGFMTGILFWMTPQDPKPSCHDVMVGNWKPSPAEIAKGLNPPGFGVTIMVINGGLEGNLGESDSRVGRRVGHYRDITGKMGVDINGEKLDTLGMQQF